MILDFFAGSGTTTHAVARLNRRDGGRRQSIIVTNNEVSDAEARRLRAEGHRPGDAEWDALGIFEHVTNPRIEAAVKGCRPDGSPIPPTLKYIDGQTLAAGLNENVEFFALTYLDPEDVEISAAFEGIAPLLWLRAGGRGEMVEHDAPYYAVLDTYGVLFNPDRWGKFVSDLHDDAKTVFIVTDSPSMFAAIAAELPAGVEAVRELPVDVHAEHAADRGDRGRRGVRHDLFDYQREAAITILKRLDAERYLWTHQETRSSFALSAVTASGKTVIATAVIEAMVHGSADLGADPDPRAVFLWVTIHV